ncbi:MAG: gliding motility-associated C-terminal domain-containing protein [Sphingobacteriia bacterium]|nr:gliding motility-associated C-terminal domain-containing protein [Sphingobacteriia bacterium]
MKKVVLVCLVLLYFVPARATHISGGELYYQYIGPGSNANTSRYKITMRLFRDYFTTSAAQLNGEVVNVGIYAQSNSSFVSSLILTQEFTNPPPLLQNTPNINPCLTGNPKAWYQIGTYSATIDLAITQDGYILSWVRYSRVDLANLPGTNQNTGADFITYIPGTGKLPNGFNSSPQFAIKDTSIICKTTHFTLDYSATDSDNDSLAYRFTPAYDGAANTSLSAPNPIPGVNFSTLYTRDLIYASPYSGLQPLGTGVTIDAKTGIISGVAPAAGQYVVCVIAEEWRNGVLINTHRKDFILKVNDCSLTAAQLEPSYITCNGFTMNFQNESSSSNIASYAWTFGDVNNVPKDTSSQPTPTYTYKDTGTFNMKLVVTGTGGCKDSTNALVRVYPGFKPGFKVVSSCILNPYLFIDTTYTKYGVVNSWNWKFDDASIAPKDTSSQQNPSHLYSSTGNKNVKLVVTNSKGCIDSLLLPLNVKDKPFLRLPFHDTLICSIDTLPLIANITSGSVEWTPDNKRIINPKSINPLVYPTDTTKYYVTVTDNGCINTDSVTVNVLQYISVYAGRDTGICKTDTIRLHPVSDALSYQWTANTGVAVTSTKYPLIQPLTTTKYYVTANLGKCQASDSVTVRVTPYPQIQVSADTTICYGGRAQLRSNIVGSNFQWWPVNTLINANTLNPVAGPQQTTKYILMVSDNIGCPKPVYDTITVTVIPAIKVFAGRDTTIVANQPLQLNALVSNNGSFSYTWAPTTGLDNPFIQNPIATLNAAIDSIRYVVTAQLSGTQCTGYDDIWVKVFKTGPDIFVPSAFTPNNDGRNDIIKPIPVGISKFDFFRIYNRWGQLVYSTSEIGRGWDGRLSGVEQPSGTYVFVTQGTDYTGKVITRKGTIVLIR